MYVQPWLLWPDTGSIDQQNLDAVPDLLIANQIANLSLSGRPLIVADVDEVVTEFVRPLEKYLERRGFRLDVVSYGLTGNIKHAGTERAANKEVVSALLQAFFDAEIHSQPLVIGAAESLDRLAAHADIVLLTNAPDRHREARRFSLAKQGVQYPLLMNDGPKGPAMKQLAARTSGLVFFLDDSPTNLHSVANALPNAHILHFVADPRFLALAPDIPGTHVKTGKWIDAEAYITGVLERLGD
jgi:hypothetical protein